MSAEEWRPIPGFQGYMVSTLGQIQNPSGKVLPGHLDRGYRVICTTGNRKIRVHRAVLEAFVGAPAPGNTASHLNGDPSDNRLENLKWESLGDNLRRKTGHGTMTRGTQMNTARLNEDQVRELRKLRSEGWLLRSLAERYGITVTAVGYIANRRNWAWVQ